MELLPSLLSALKTVDPETVKQEYRVVCSQTSILKSKLGLTCEVGAVQENIKKNRYKDVLPYDQSRVVLSLPATNCNSDYINASFIQGATANRTYIASQGPLSSTVMDFWRMIWQYDVKVIVMACREIEMGKKKCERYWAQLHQSVTFGPFTVCNEAETEPTDEVVVRNLNVTYNQETHSLVQYHFLSWPDHDVPYEAQGVLDLLDRARNTQGTHTSPVLVHCSAGCGRTGVICVLDYIHDLLVTKDQYLFIFRAVTSMFECSLRDSVPLDSNLAEVPDKETTRRPPTTNRLSQTAMNDTYAVVNKPKRLQVDAAASTPPSNLYDNDLGGAPVYSTVKPRAKRTAVPIPTTAHKEMHRESSVSFSSDGGFHLISAEGAASIDHEYEVFSTSAAQTSPICSPGQMGFNFRVQKPRGPRDLPAEWRQL